MCCDLSGFNVNQIKGIIWNDLILVCILILLVLKDFLKQQQNPTYIAQTQHYTRETCNNTHAQVEIRNKASDNLAAHASFFLITTQSKQPCERLLMKLHGECHSFIYVPIVQDFPESLFL